MKNTALILLLFLPLMGMTQTGPGGVGNSTNNVLWLDASLDVTLSGSDIIDISDQSGNNNTALAPTVTKRPLLIPSSVNNYDAMRFDGANDELRVSDNATLDLTQWDNFVVTRANLNKNYNGIYAKGNDAFENIEFLGFADGSFHLPIRFTNGSRPSPNTTTGQYSTTSFDIFEYSFAPSIGRDVYKNNAIIETDNDLGTPLVNSNELYIGNEQGTAGRFLNGEIAELIFYNAPLNTAQRIIVNNYLSAKYDLNLVANDIYDEDNTANGDYDHEVAGIGRVNASNIHNDAQGTGVLTINNPTGLDDNEFLIWGHDNQSITASNIVDVPSATVGARISRTWKFSEVDNLGGSVDVGAIDIQFDLTSLAPIDADDLSLLIDTNGDGFFSDEVPIFGATDMGSNIYRFSGVTDISDNLSFTLGTERLAGIPTLGEWGLIILALLLINLSVVMMMRKRSKSSYIPRI